MGNVYTLHHWALSLPEGYLIYLYIEHLLVFRNVLNSNRNKRINCLIPHPSKSHHHKDKACKCNVN